MTLGVLVRLADVEQPGPGIERGGQFVHADLVDRHGRHVTGLEIASGQVRRAVDVAHDVRGSTPTAITSSPAQRTMHGALTG